MTTKNNDKKHIHRAMKRVTQKQLVTRQELLDRYFKMIRTAVFALSFLMNLRFKQVNDVLILIIITFFWYQRCGELTRQKSTLNGWAHRYEFRNNYNKMYSFAGVFRTL